MAARLRETRPSLPRGGSEGHPAGPVAGCAATRACDSRRGRDGHPGFGRGERVSDGAGGRGFERDGARMRHTLSILVENRFGELSRIVGLFSARGYNIESLTVAETMNPSVSRITLVTNGDDQTVDKITRQVEKQVRVLNVTNMTRFQHTQ